MKRQAGSAECRPCSQPAAGRHRPGQVFPRPNIPKRESIGEYHDSEIRRLIEWIGSDGCLRTDEEIIEELLPELGFSRRGTRIEATLRNAVESYRARRRPDSAV